MIISAWDDKDNLSVLHLRRILLKAQRLADRYEDI